MHLTKLLPLAFTCSASALPVVTLPWLGQVPLSGLVRFLGYSSDLPEEKTIYEILKEDKQYTRLVKAIDFSESIVGLLNDTSKSITFFAVPNSKLPHHRKPHHGHHGNDESIIPFFTDDISNINHDFGDLVQQVEDLDEDLDSHDKEKRKHALAHIIHKILAYHILPEAYETADLVKNSTYATNLTLCDGSMDWEPLRLNVVSSSIPFSLTININAEVTRRDIRAKNGVIHQISRPLLPPPSIFQKTFSLPGIFSFYTTAIQRVGLIGAIDRWKHPRGDGHEVSFMGATATTAFVPTSGAFKHLPEGLKSYLFSPFGRRALKKLLEYHIVPNFVLHADYFHNATSDTTKFVRNSDGTFEMQFEPEPVSAFLDGDVEGMVLSRSVPVPRFLELVYEYNATLPTLLRNHHIQVHAARYKANLPIHRSQYFTSLKVNGKHVGLFDIPARNGALHVLTTILDPRKGREDCGKTEDQHAWENWEEWLPQWAQAMEY